MPRLLANVAFTSAHALCVGGREGTALGTEGATVGTGAPSTVMPASCEHLKIQIPPAHGSSEKKKLFKK